jgi:hypothetical protein
LTSYPNSSPHTLSDSHQRQLKGSAIAEEVAAARGYRTIRRRSEVPDDFANWQRRLGLLVPTHSPDGQTSGYQLKPNKPILRKTGNAPKYETPAESRITLDVNPLMLEEVRGGDSDLWVTEGPKKVDAFTSQGEPTVGIIGVWNFAEPGSKSRTPLSCWNHVRLRGRRVIIVYDADARTNPDVQEALRRLVTMLEGLGAEVLVVYLPAVNGDGKSGVDDYLAAGGTVAELRLMAAPYQPVDVGAERMSRDEKLRARVEDLERRFWALECKGMGGHTDRDVYLKLIEAAKRHGKIHPDGIRVVKAQGPLALEVKISSRTLWKSLNRLEDMELCYRDNEGWKAERAGAFVLRAGVSHKGRKPGQEGGTTPQEGGYGHGDLHLRAPRQRWSSPRRKRRLRYGMVPGTRQMRSKPTTEQRVPDKMLDGVPRLGKIRGAVLDALDVAGGTLTLTELCDVLHRSRPRDVKRRLVPKLEEAGIIETSEAGDVISLTADWLEALARVTDQDADEKARKSYKQRRDAFRAHRDGVSAAGRESVRASREKRAEHLKEAPSPESSPPPSLSPLAQAVRDYLERSPRDARHPPGWIGNTLWALELYPGLPTPAESKAAIEELGGATYLYAKLMEAKGAA